MSNGRKAPAVPIPSKICRAVPLTWSFLCSTSGTMAATTTGSSSLAFAKTAASSQRCPGEERWDAPSRSNTNKVSIGIARKSVPTSARVSASRWLANAPSAESCNWLMSNNFAAQRRSNTLLTERPSGKQPADERRRAPRVRGAPTLWQWSSNKPRVDVLTAGNGISSSDPASSIRSRITCEWCQTTETSTSNKPPSADRSLNRPSGASPATTSSCQFGKVCNSDGSEPPCFLRSRWRSRHCLRAVRLLVVPPSATLSGRGILDGGYTTSSLVALDLIL
mmetsp:Transcript_58970/g.164792  ORF Transcript_58970/g.164792 Transcript_58970/m.164792 type:complete len:279 (-) Transcript_58970:57-893(-)